MIMTAAMTSLVSYVKPALALGVFFLLRGANIIALFLWSPWKLYPLEHLVAVAATASALYSIMNIHSMQITTSTGFENLLTIALN